MKRFALLMMAGTAFADTGPSFDCTKASAEVEHLICGDAELSALDARLAQAWKSYFSSITFDDVRAQALEKQRNWLVQRESGTRADLKAEYELRNSILEGEFLAAADERDFNVFELKISRSDEDGSHEYTGRLMFDNQSDFPQTVRTYLWQRAGDDLRSALEYGHGELWSASSSFRVEYKDDRLVVIDEFSDDTGGAYPNYYGYARYFDAKTDAPMEFTDIFVEDAIPSVEAYFNEALKTPVRDSNAEHLDEDQRARILSEIDSGEIDGLPSSLEYGFIARFGEKPTHFEITFDRYTFQWLGEFWSDLEIPAEPILQFIKPEYRESFANGS